tara:strand:- start:53123 stop:53452 length:330 start_codon:yes stop_codon:yes gene_type:complete
MYKIVREEEVIKKEIIEVNVSLCGYIGHKIHEDRVKADINIRQLSDRLNKQGHQISKSSVATIEKGNESLKVNDLLAISQFFGKNITDYFPSESVFVKPVVNLAMNTIE